MADIVNDKKTQGPGGPEQAVGNEPSAPAVGREERMPSAEHRAAFFEAAAQPTVREAAPTAVDLSVEQVNAAFSALQAGIARYTSGQAFTESDRRELEARDVAGGRGVAQALPPEVLALSPSEAEPTATIRPMRLAVREGDSEYDLTPGQNDLNPTVITQAGQGPMRPESLTFLRAEAIAA